MHFIDGQCHIQQLKAVNQSHHITLLVINSLRGGHTHIDARTKAISPARAWFKNDFYALLCISQLWVFVHVTFFDVIVYIVIVSGVKRNLMCRCQYKTVNRTLIIIIAICIINMLRLILVAIYVASMIYSTATHVVRDDNTIIELAFNNYYQAMNMSGNYISLSQTTGFYSYVVTVQAR